MSTDKWCFKQTANYSLWDSRLPPRCTIVVRSLLIISSRDCREADSRDTSPKHAKFGFMILPSITMEVAFQLYSFHWTAHTWPATALNRNRIDLIRQCERPPRCSCCNIIIGCHRQIYNSSVKYTNVWICHVLCLSWPRQLVRCFC